MGVDVTHLVLEALGDTDDQVVDQGSDGSERGDVLSRAVVNLNANNILLRSREVNRDVAQVLGKLACFSPLDSFAPPGYIFAIVMAVDGIVPRGPSTVTLRDLIWTLTVSRVACQHSSK